MDGERHTLRGGVFGDIRAEGRRKISGFGSNSIFLRAQGARSSLTVTSELSSFFPALHSCLIGGRRLILEAVMQGGGDVAGDQSTCQQGVVQ